MHFEVTQLCKEQKFCKWKVKYIKATTVSDRNNVVQQPKTGKHDSSKIAPTYLLVLTSFCLIKGCLTLFRLETIFSNSVHPSMFIYKVFIARHSKHQFIVLFFLQFNIIITKVLLNKILLFFFFYRAVNVVKTYFNEFVNA